MENFNELALRRQSCRNFSDKELKKETLLEIAKTALLAPSACNSQPWQIVIVTDKEKCKQIAETTQTYGFNQWDDKAQAFVIMGQDAAPELKPSISAILKSDKFAAGDVGIVTAFFVLAAAEHGVGTCIIGVFDEEKVKDIAGIAPKDKISVLIACGYPADETIRPKMRKALEESVRII